MSEREFAEKYFANIRNHDLDDLIACFAESAMLALPDGREFSGAAAIREMYRGLFAAQSPSPNLVSAIAGENGVATEMEIHLPNGAVRRTANFFYLNANGLIERLTIYARGG